MEFWGMPLFNTKDGEVDKPFVLILLLLVGIGLIMMFSASYANALYYHQDSTLFIRKQFGFAVVGLFAMWVTSNVNYRLFKKAAWPLYGLSMFLLVLVLFLPKINDVHRWIDIGPINFQPSEVAKFALIVLFALMIDLNFHRMHTFQYGILPFACLLGLVIILLLCEPHLSGSIIVIAICALMLWAGGADKRWFILGVFVVALGLLVVLGLDSLGYAGTRIALWKDPFVDPRGDGYQTIQSMYAIASGGLYGTGIGGSRQKYLFLPEPHNDFIFSVICEELGFVGAVVILMLFALLIYRGFVIATSCHDRFGSLFAIGLVGQVGIQTVLNIGVVTNALPNTGISLPFFSYGGTSLIMLLVQMGIVLSISRDSGIEKK